MVKALSTFTVRPWLPAQLEPLSELAANLRWAWDRRTRELFRWADLDAWERTGHNPVALLGALPGARLRALSGDASFLAELSAVSDELRRYLTEPRWAQSREPGPPRVAYFSPEFGLTHTVQIYSGGLGVLAGDHLKSASDLGLDMVAVGLVYRHGYFHQRLDADGWQQERYPDLNPHDLPLRPLARDGAPVTVEVPLAGRPVHCRVWTAQVGRVPLLLLDTDVPANAPEDRGVTDKLYGGDVEHRLRQELVLGVAGVRAIDAARELGLLDAPPQMFHSNEGHAGFLQLERVRRLVVDGKLTFAEAIQSARAAVVFTTHTPVPAGIDVFPRQLMERYLGWLARDCGVGFDELMAVGQLEPAPDASFNMAVMGLRLSARANGVSRLHGRVSRSMFGRVWPGVGADEAPITAVTNGVHAASWTGPEMTAVFDRALAPDWPHNPGAWARAGDIGDDVLWRARGRARERLVQRVRGHVREQHLRRGDSPGSLGWTDEVFDPDTLTVGFARRFAEYKRGTLLLRHPERLKALLGSTDRPVQLVFAGKAHPRDETGKDLIRRLVRFSADPEARTRLVFVEDYDMELARVLYQGCDVWLNNPRRPHEACGTSGMKSVLNGGLHCSTLDGWWDEMYDGDNGFAIGGRVDYPDAAHHDAADVQALYELLERAIVPMYYDRVEGPLPRRWLARVRRSLRTLGPQVLATRMVREYVDELYVPLAQRAARLVEDDHRRARDLAAWCDHVARCWRQVSVRAVHTDRGVAQLGDRRAVRAVVLLGELSPADVSVELLHGPVQADGLLREATVERLELAGTDDGGGVYSGAFDCATAGEYGLAVRVVPSNDDLVSWSDLGLVSWARVG